MTMATQLSEITLGQAVERTESAQRSSHQPMNQAPMPEMNREAAYLANRAPTAAADSIAVSRTTGEQEIKFCAREGFFAALVDRDFGRAFTHLKRALLVQAPEVIITSGITVASAGSAYWLLQYAGDFRPVMNEVMGNVFIGLGMTALVGGLKTLVDAVSALADTERQEKARDSLEIILAGKRGKNQSRSLFSLLRTQEEHRDCEVLGVATRTLLTYIADSTQPAEYRSRQLMELLRSLNEAPSGDRRDVLKQEEIRNSLLALASEVTNKRSSEDASIVWTEVFKAFSHDPGVRSNSFQILLGHLRNDPKERGSGYQVKAIAKTLSKGETAMLKDALA